MRVRRNRMMTSPTVQPTMKTNRASMKMMSEI
jgi:hypothetical protein